MEQTTRTRIWRVARWALVALVLAAVAKTAVDVVAGGPGFHNVPFREWYGDWREVAVVTAIFLAFLLGFARPRRRAEWRNAGVYSAFLISLFAEMFGVPLTIYLLAPVLGLPATAFGMNESHLWAFALDRLGWVPLRGGVFAVMAISTALIAAGLSLLALGWATVYRGRGGLVTGGIYRWLRHPQYVGLILIVVAFTAGVRVPDEPARDSVAAARSVGRAVLPRALRRGPIPARRAPGPGRCGELLGVVVHPVPRGGPGAGGGLAGSPGPRGRGRRGQRPGLGACGTRVH